MEELIEYLDKQLKLKPSDLLMEDFDRAILMGQIDLLNQIKEIHEKGYPPEETE